MFGPNSVGTKPLMLVPLDQVTELVKDIQAEFNIPVDVPPYPFQLSFHDDATPSPQILGKVNSKEDMQSLQAKIPEPPLNHDELAQDIDRADRQNHLAWREKAERALAAEKRKSLAAKKKKAQNHALTLMETANQLSRAQRHLGLQPRFDVTQKSLPNTSVVGSRDQHIQQASSYIGALDVNQPVCFPFEDQPIIISIDVEAFEMDHKIITEIGLSTLDTLDLVDLAPDEQGKQWIKKIRSRHFRIKGRETLRNAQFVNGNPEMFQFGISEFVTINEAADAVNSCFEPPYSSGFECEGPPQFDEKGLLIERNPPTLRSPCDTADGNNFRNLLLLGHDINTDISYLASLRGSVFGTTPSTTTPDGSVSQRQRVLSSIRECLDTSVLHKALTKNNQPKSLSKICHELDITPWFAHNAGNDARYTLEAFIKLVIKARQQHDTEKALDVRSVDGNSVNAPQGNTSCVASENSSHALLKKPDYLEPPDANTQSSSSYDIASLETKYPALNPTGTAVEIAETTNKGPEYNSDDEYPY